MLQTARADVFNTETKSSVKTRILFDTGSRRCYANEKVRKHLNVNTIRIEKTSISKNLCSKSTHKSIKTQLIEHRIEWKAIIITLAEMTGRKRLRLIRLIRKN